MRSDRNPGGRGGRVSQLANASEIPHSQLSPRIPAFFFSTLLDDTGGGGEPAGVLPARYHLIGALVIDRLATNRGARVCVHASRRSRADCNELISARGRGSAIFLSFTLFLSPPLFFRVCVFQQYNLFAPTHSVSAENSRERSRYIMEREEEREGKREIGLQGKSFPARRFINGSRVAVFQSRS